MTEIDPCPLCGALPCDWVDNPHVAEASQTIKSLTARAEAAEAEVQRLTYNGIHTCHAECPRLPCVQRREIEALTAVIETHEAFRQEVSDAVERFNQRWADSKLRQQDWEEILRFIITKPVDPLVEALSEIDHAAMAPNKCADELRAALAARGLEIKEIEK